MKKYHINDKGLVVECKASIKSCPKQNFDSKEEAEIFLKETNKSFNTLKRKKDNVSFAKELYDTDKIFKHEIKLSKEIENFIDDLDTFSNPVLVGGIVRDSFTDSPSKDVDIEVRNISINDLIKNLKSKGYYIDEVGKQFGILKVSGKNGLNDIDLSVPRKENQTGSGHTGFSVELDPKMTVKEAAERRDFTFNSMMYDPKLKVLIDPYDGKKDLENKIMRHVSDKFDEDPLRPLRGVQFAGRFGMSFSPDTIIKSEKLKEKYSELSIERVQGEWAKLYDKSNDLVKGLKALQEIGWDDTIPGLKKSLDEKTLNEVKIVPTLPQNKKVKIGSAIISKNMSEEDRKIFLNSTVIDNKTKTFVKKLVNIDKQDVDSTYKRKVLAKKLYLSGVTFEDYEIFSKAINDSEGVKISNLAKKEGVFSKPENDLIMGRDLLEKTDRKPGEWMGKLLLEVRDLQYKGQFSNKEEALDYAIQNNSKF